MLVAILTGLVAALILDRILFPQKDKAGREAIKELGEILNRRVEFYDFIRDAGVYSLDYNYNNDVITRKEVKARENVFREEMDLKMQMIIEKAKSVDLEIADGLNALAAHFKLEVLPYSKPAEKGMEVVKIKKSKK